MSNSNKVVRNKPNVNNKKTENKTQANQKRVLKKNKLQSKGKYLYFIGGAIFIILGMILQEYATIGIGVAIIASYILGQIYKKTISKW